MTEETIPNKKSRRAHTKSKKDPFDETLIEIDLDDEIDIEGDLLDMKESNPIGFNTENERRFVAIVQKLLAKYGPMRRRVIQIETAARCHISTETAKRYLDKHSASILEFTIKDGWVTERKKKK